MTQDLNQKQVVIPTLIDNDAQLPSAASHGASGADVRAHINEPLVLLPGESALIPTGLRFAIPQGYEIQVRPRSGLALKHQITVLNSPGTIDSDYRGELGIILINHGKNSFTVEPGMRIAQLVVAEYVLGCYTAEDSLVQSSRGAGGFGHTGLH